MHLTPSQRAMVRSAYLDATVEELKDAIDNGNHVQEVKDVIKEMLDACLEAGVQRYGDLPL